MAELTREASQPSVRDAVERLSPETKCPECPLTRAPFESPWVYSDGHSYEGRALRNWLDEHPCVSPLTQQAVPSNRLCLNRTLRDLLEEWKRLQTPPAVPRCPLTHEPFREPVVLMEDGHTYEREAVERFFERKTNLSTVDELLANQPLLHPKTPLNTALKGGEAHLVPNVTLAQVLGLSLSALPPPSTVPVHRGVTLAQPLATPLRDERVRELLQSLSGDSGDSGKIAQLRQRLAALERFHGMDGYGGSFPHLVNLDLSDLQLSRLHTKSAVFVNCDFSRTIFVSCGFSRGRFVACKFDDSIFVDGLDLRGEEVYFGHCSFAGCTLPRDLVIEQGDTWNRLVSEKDIVDEFKQRGALGTESIQFAD